MRRLETWIAVVVVASTAACAGQPATETAGAAAIESSSEAAQATPEPTAEPTEEPTEEPTASPTAEPTSACDLVLADSDLPVGLSASEPESETMEDLEAKVEAAAEGTPGRAAAEANATAYQEMGLVERCVRGISGSASGASFSSGALIFEDETGPQAYVQFLSEGCGTVEVPGSDVTGIVCTAGFPVAYLVARDGSVAQSVSATPRDPTAFDQEALVAEALTLIEALPSRAD